MYWNDFYSRAFLFMIAVTLGTPTIRGAGDEPNIIHDSKITETKTTRLPRETANGCCVAAKVHSIDSPGSAPRAYPARGDPDRAKPG